MFFSQDVRGLRRRLNAILQREDPCGGTDHGPYGFCCRAHIPGLDTQEDSVNDAHGLRAIRG